MNLSIPGTNIGLSIKDEEIQRLNNWAVLGAPMPCPAFIKQMVVLQYAKVYELKSFIETGTYLGETLKLVADLGLQCKSVELSEELYKNAQKNFAGYKNVELFHGDSSAMMGAMIERAEAPHLFWLDGHFSGGFTVRGSSDTPIAQELDQLLNYDIQNSVILIDDIRDFGKGDYPTVDYLENFARSKLPNHVFENVGDIFRITPKTGLIGRIAQNKAAGK